MREPRIAKPSKLNENRKSSCVAKPSKSQNRIAQDWKLEEIRAKPRRSLRLNSSAKKPVEGTQPEHDLGRI